MLPTSRLRSPGFASLAASSATDEIERWSSGEEQSRDAAENNLMRSTASPCVDLGEPGAMSDEAGARPVLVPVAAAWSSTMIGFWSHLPGGRLTG